MPTDRISDFAEMSGPVGPDSLRLPGAPQHLQSAVQGLQALGQELDRVSTDLKAANPPGPNPGRTVGAVSRIAQRTGAALDDDVQRLKALEQSVDHVRELIHGGQQDALPELRQRWSQARQQLIEAVQAENAENAQREQEREREQREREQERRDREDREDRDGRGGRGDRGGRWEQDDDRPRLHAEVVDFEPHRPQQEPINGMALARHIDDNQVEEYDGLFRRLFGTVFREPGGDVAGAFNRGGQIENAIQEYRRTVRGVLEEYAQLVQRIESADEELAQKLPREERAVLHAVQVDLGQAQAEPAEPSVSSPAVIRKLAQELHTQAQALNKADNQLEDIRLAMRSGRMLGQGERVGSNDGFKTDWMAHLQDLRQRLNGSHEKAMEVAQKMQQLDESGATEVRQAGRADKD